jgi:uncharacterized membrane protein YgcG
MTRALVATLLAFSLSSVSVGALAQSAPTGSGPCVATDALGATPLPAGGRVKIEQICSNGQRIASATIGVALGNAPSAATKIVTGASFDTPATFTTDAGITIDVISSNGNQQRVSPSTSVFQSVGKLGELFSVATGNVRAFVSNRLSFYNIQSLKVIAASRGTVFDVDAKPDASVTFSITEGKISLARLVSIRLTAENRTVDGIRVTDTITPSAVASITYPVPFPIFKVFANAAEAEAYFEQQLHQAQSNGDELQIEDALENIERVEGVVPPAALNPANAHTVTNAGVANANGTGAGGTGSGSASSGGTATGGTASGGAGSSATSSSAATTAAASSPAFSLPIVGAVGVVLGVAAAGVATNGFKSNSTSQSGNNNQGLQGGTVTIQGHKRRAVSFSIAIPIRL